MSRRFTTLMPVLCLLVAAASAQDFAPFPENRLRDFYFRQAEHHLSTGKPVPELLPQFPGLDGGAFGHWGQNPAERSVDRTLNSVDSGNIICSHVRHFGRNTHKGVAIRLTDDGLVFSALFDPVAMSFTDAWTGGFVTRGSGRFGVHDGATASGNQLPGLNGSRWRFPESTSARYEGFYRNGGDVVFKYRAGVAEVYDRMWVTKGSVIRSLQVKGKLPAGSRLILIRQDANASDKPAVPTLLDQSSSQGAVLETQKGVTEAVFDGGVENRLIHIVYAAGTDPAAEESGRKPVPESPMDMIAGGPGQWVDDLAITTGVAGDSRSAFAIDTLTIPYATANPFGTPMRLAGVGVLDADRIAVSTLLGDVWVVSGLQKGLGELKWQRMAAGLYQPLGLVVQDGKIICGGNDQITRLHDLNGDGEADFYECVTNDYPTTGGHDFATSLQQDDQGRLYWATASRDFGLTRLGDGGKPESLGSGLRNSNGIGVSADGAITLATVQEGSWTPATAIFNVGNGSFHGHRGPRKEVKPLGYDLPQCFVPRGIDNSAGEISFLPEDARLGPLSGLTIGSSYGYCNHYLVLREEVQGRVQGGVVPLPGEFISGACRLKFNPHDGCVYVAGTEGWQSYGAEKGCLQRLRFTGNPLHLATRIETRFNGLIVHCNTKIDPSSVKTENLFCQQWNYLFSAAYGSPEYSVRDEGRQGHDYVPVKSVHLLSDGRSVFIEIPQLHPVMQFHLHMKLRAADGEEFTPDAYLSIYEMGEAFTDFPGYQLITKRRWPDFPVAESYERDPRLVEQDSLGTNFGWVSSAKKMELKAVTGLQYAPNRLRVAPGSRVALTFHNTDPGMPHNVVIVDPEGMERLGEASMILASNPRAIATHYVPDDPAEICFSPILNPGDQYTVYFEAPKNVGRYRFLCTYPGHWKVMRGSLYVLPDDQPLPEPAADEIVRRFVRQWTSQDFVTGLADLSDRSVANGKKVFDQAGCIKCHKIGLEGAKIGPDLSEVSKQYQGRKLLQQILEPSTEINKKFRTWIAVGNDGTVTTGLMVREDDQSVTLLPNPLKPEETVTLHRHELDELLPSKQSTMPKGLLMTFRRDEILDLLAYLQKSRGVSPQP